MILELKDKILEVPRARPVVAGRQPRSERDQMVEDVVSALLNLGCSRKEATRAAETARQDLGTEADFEKLVKQALKNLSEGTAKRG